MASVNAFDVAVIVIMIVAIIMGFQSGLLRALATILGYICAAPIAIGASPTVAQMLTLQLRQPVPDWAVFAGLFVVVGILLAALMRMTVGALTGEHIGIADRMAGA